MHEKFLSLKTNTYVWMTGILATPFNTRYLCEYLRAVFIWDEFSGSFLRIVDDINFCAFLGSKLLVGTSHFLRSTLFSFSLLISTYKLVSEKKRFLPRSNHKIYILFREWVIIINQSSLFYHINDYNKYKQFSKIYSKMIYAVHSQHNQS